MILLIGQLQQHEEMIAESELQTAEVSSIETEGVYIGVVFMKVMAFDDWKIAEKKGPEEADEYITDMIRANMM